MNDKNDFKNYARSEFGISSLKMSQYEDQISASMTPYIIEEREMRATQIDIFSRLMKDRLIWLAGGIDDSVSTVVQAQLMYLNSVDSMDITMHIDTPGGSVKSGLSIIDVMNYVDVDIITINTGMAASMGSVLLAAGAKGKRSSLTFSKVMTHQLSHGNNGNIQDTRINQMEAEKYNYILFQMLSEYTGRDFKEVLEFSSRDRWYNAAQAKEFGIIDEVITNNNQKQVGEYLDGFEDYYNKEVLNKD